jgi:hypothetical protein
MKGVLLGLTTIDKPAGKNRLGVWSKGFPDLWATSLPPINLEKIMNTKELRKKVESAQQKTLALTEVAFDEIDHMKNEVAKLIQGDPEQFINNVRSVQSKLRAFAENNAFAEKLGYTSTAKALDALSRTKPEKLIALPD